MPYYRYSLLATLALSLIIIISCEPDEEEKGECDTSDSCLSTSFSFVDPDNYKNLMGYDGQPIHPDSIAITNSRGDTMSHKTYQMVDGWVELSYFNPFQEITCFNQCLLDSAFTRTYYVYIGNDDLDTLEVYFPERAQNYTIFYNGVSGEVPDDIPKEQRPGRSVFYLLKSF